MDDKALIAKTIGGVAEVVGHELSPVALTIMVRDLARYPEDQVIAALYRCARECKYKLTLADIIGRLDDGRPGVEEAWAMMPRDEEMSVVWTNEMAEAFGSAQPLLADSDAIAARMAFKEHYQRAVQRARDDGKQVRWTPTLGHDPSGREGVLLEAVRLGRIGKDQAQQLVPDLRIPPSLQPMRTLIDGVAAKLLPRV